MPRVVRPVDRHLTLEHEDGGIDERDAQEMAGVVDQVAGGEVVRAVEHHIVPPHDLEGIVGPQGLAIADDLDIGVEILDPLDGGVDLGLADGALAVQDLALEIAAVDVVVVDDADRPHPGGCQIERRRRTQPAGADQQHAGIQQLDLAGLAQVGQDEMAGVAFALVGPQKPGDVELKPGVLPAIEPARHRVDAAVAQLLQVVGRQQATHTAGAIEDDHRLAIRLQALDLQLEKAAAKVEGAGQVPLHPFVVLADVDHRHILALAQPLVHLPRGRLVHLGADAGQKLVARETGAAAPRHGRDDRELVGRADGSGQPLQGANLIVIDEDVDEAFDLAAGVEKALPEAGMGGFERIEGLGDGGAGDFDPGLVGGQSAQGGGDEDGWHG